MPDRTRKTPNPAILFRLAALPVLWAFALSGWRWPLAAGLALAALSDVVDGWLARRWPRFADGRLDSIADKLLSLSAVLWLALLQPALISDHPWLLSAGALVYCALLAAGWRRHGRISTLHTHLGKLGGLVQAVFVFHSLLTGAYSPLLFYPAVGLFILAAAEELLILLAYRQVDDERLRSILPYVRDRLDRPTR